ncbi:MAG: winged helix-turn-helix transcriptional regulator [Bacteroidales bacterium]|nr:winged helix-turn-helix transcriptional regulator [Bacteroidales bacterium]
MFYKSFFKEFKNWNNLNWNEKIVYSFLVNYAIMHQDYSWDNASKSEEGVYKINMNEINFLIDENERLWLRISQKKIAEKTDISLRTIATIMGNFRDKGIIDYDSILVPKGFINNGFLKLPTETGLNGFQRIFWAFINERLKHYNNKCGKENNLHIDTWASTLAKDMGVEKKSVIQNCIHCLTEKNYLKRNKETGLLAINTKLHKIKTPKQVKEEKEKKKRKIKEYEDLPF